MKINSYHIHGRRKIIIVFRDVRKMYARNFGNSQLIGSIFTSCFALYFICNEPTYIIYILVYSVNMNIFNFALTFKCNLDKPGLNHTN